MFTPTIAFLTALPLEFKAVEANLPAARESKTIEHKKYTVCQLGPWRVVVRQQHSQGNYQAARETEWLIQHFNPAYLFFVGVAGGIKDVNLGDVVVATLAKGYESVKVKDGVTYPRLHVEYSSQNLVEQAFELARNWQPKTWVCPIASGEKLVSDETLLKELKQHCSDAVAVEMEAIGFLGSIRQREGMVKGIVIRGISDRIVGKNPNDDEVWQPTAAKNAAAFAWAMLESLPLPTELPMSPSLDTGVFSVPQPRNDYFTGREEMLQQMQAGLAKQAVVALCGLGGMGKTQTLVEYAHRHRGEYVMVGWVSAETLENFRLGLLTLAGELQLPCAGRTPEEVQQSVEQWLQTHPGWLLLLDNVEDLMGVFTFLQKVKRSGHLLLSTRLTDTRPLAEPLEIVSMTEDEGVDLLYRHMGHPPPSAEERAGTEAQEALALVRLLGGLPLALDQAAAYLAGGKTFRRYRELYQTHGLELLKKRGLLAHPTDHPDPVAVT